MTASSISMPKRISKRHKPPNINVAAAAADRRAPVLHVQPSSPADDTLQLSDNELDGTLQLASSSDYSPAAPSASPASAELADGDTPMDMAALQQLRKSVKTNLRLRPIRSNNALPKVSFSPDNQPGSSRLPPLPQKTLVTTPSASVWNDLDPPVINSPSSAVSCYFTPLTPAFRRDSTDSDTSSPPLDADLISRPIPPGILYDRLTSSTRPLLIDTRPPTLHHAFNIRHSINVAIPTLILKRSRKPNAGFQSIDTLRQYVTTDQGRLAWDELMRPSGPWDGDVVVYDDEMDSSPNGNARSTAWALMPILAPLLRYGFVNYLEGGISSAGHHPDLETLIVTATDIAINDDPVPPQTPFSKGLRTGLFQLDTGSALRSKPLPEIEPSSSSSSNASPSPPLLSPLPMMPASIPAASSLSLQLPAIHKLPILSHHGDIADLSPSPPPSHITFKRPAPPPRRPSVPNLRRLDTNSVCGLSIRAKPMRSATLAVPPSLTLSIQVPASPTHLKLVHSNISSPESASSTFSDTPPPSTITATGASFASNGVGFDELMTPYYTPPHTPFTPKPPSSLTPRPMLDTIHGMDDSPPSSEDGYPTFNVSTILPNFLYLGPELTAPEHVEELRELGVKRILNIAAECDDDHGLGLRSVFEKYVKIPMRDTVEEDNIAWGVREVCDVLGEAVSRVCSRVVVFEYGSDRRCASAFRTYLCPLQSRQIALRDRGHGLPHTRQPLDARARLRLCAGAP